METSALAGFPLSAREEVHTGPLGAIKTVIHTGVPMLFQLSIFSVPIPSNRVKQIRTQKPATNTKAEIRQ